MSRRYWILLGSIVSTTLIVGSAYLYRQLNSAPLEERFMIDVSSQSSRSTTSSTKPMKSSKATIKARAFIPLDKIPYAVPSASSHILNDPHLITIPNPK